MRHRSIALLLATGLALPLAACSADMEEREYVTKAPAATVTGDPVRCIQTSLIENTEVHDDRVIDFKMRTRQTYRNTLPSSCPTLGFEEKFAYRTTTSQLCSIDTITVFNSGGTRGPTCGLGEFVPIELVKD